MAVCIHVSFILHTVCLDPKHTWVIKGWPVLLKVVMFCSSMEGGHCIAFFSLSWLAVNAYLALHICHSNQVHLWWPQHAFHLSRNMLLIYLAEGAVAGLWHGDECAISQTDSDQMVVLLLKKKIFNLSRTWQNLLKLPCHMMKMVVQLLLLLHL